LRSAVDHPSRFPDEFLAILPEHSTQSLSRLFNALVELQLSDETLLGSEDCIAIRRVVLLAELMQRQSIDAAKERVNQ
jgi:hypothetical protein